MTGGGVTADAEYAALLRKSQSMFEGLRDLPEYHKTQWEPHFQRTFELYTKLWKFQQDHRATLEKSSKPLKRWEVGEIASKIGQLYYHYYLRTSDTTYLREAFVFYDAIRQRRYFKDVVEENSVLLTVKNLRYNARFMVVCLLLNKRVLVRTLLDEMRELVLAYNRNFHQPDFSEWQMVLVEVENFLRADSFLHVVTESGDVVPLRRRLPHPSSHGRAFLQDAILVGNCVQQVKFSELTLDMFRMLQSLEREIDTEDPIKGGAKAGKPSNPRKFLLYRPSFGKLYETLSFALSDSLNDAALLLYLSGVGSPRHDGLMETGRPDEHGGIMLSAPMTPRKERRDDQCTTPHCLYPSDLKPMTRRPLFLIVESSMSQAFKALEAGYGQPLVCLFSPTERLEHLQAICDAGVFTLFLYSPLMGLALLMGVKEFTESVSVQCERLLEESFDEVLDSFHSIKGIDPSYLRFLEDDFTRTFILRFLFCRTALSMHETCESRPEYLPECHPPFHSPFSRTQASRRRLQP